VTSACELDLNKTVGGLGKLDTTVGHRPERFQWGAWSVSRIVQAQNQYHLRNLSPSTVLSSDATAVVPDHADDFCAQVDALTGLFFIFLFCSDIVVRTLMTLCFSPFSLFKLAVIAQGIAARHAQRQASSEQAHLYAAAFPLMGKLARRVLEEEGYLPEARPKLWYDDHGLRCNVLPVAIAIVDLLTHNPDILCLSKTILPTSKPEAHLPQALEILYIIKSYLLAPMGRHGRNPRLLGLHCISLTTMMHASG
jgi:hypothetical protein